MKKKSSTLLTLTIVVAGLMASSLAGTAFAHPHLVVTPDETDHEQMSANPIILTLGHSNEPSYGAKPGIHDGKHDVELSIQDAATTLPLAGANLKLDRYYFPDIRTFNRAASAEDATEVDQGIELKGVFGEPGIYSARQLVKDGIYGYRVYGTIDYFGVGKIPIDSTVFCITPEGNTSKFNSPGWEGSYGCVSDIDSLLFPENNNEVLRIESGVKSDSGLKQVSVTDNADVASIYSSEPSSNTFQIIATGLSGVGIAVFLGIKKPWKRNEE